MTNKFEQFINDTYKSLVSEIASADLKQSPPESEIVARVGGNHNALGMIPKALAKEPQKKAGKAKLARDKAMKALLPKMTAEYKDDTAAIVSAGKS
jgi:hypothetical protein